MDYHDSEDTEIQRAIAFSLQESSGTSSRTAIIISDDSDEDETFQATLRRALEASKAEASVNPAQESPITHAPSTHASTSNTFLTERAELERARIARQKRLRREASDMADSGSPAAKKQYLSSASNATASTSVTPSVPSSSRLSRDSGIPTTEHVFWDGEMRQVANMHANPRKDGKPTFRLTEILGEKEALSFAILSSYSLSLPWIYQFFEPTVPVIIVAQPDESGNATIKNVLPNWIRTTPFLRNGRGCMHMKFMLLFYKTGRLRVVVSTANLVDFDYRDIENTTWLQDIPLLSSPIPRDLKVTHDFPTMFQRVLHAVNVPPALKNLLRTDHPDLPLKSIDDLRTHWDWTRVRVHLIPSIAGKHEGWPQVILTGHPRLMLAVQNMHMRVEQGKGKELILECQGSSIGAYSTQWMNEFHWSARGLSAEDWLNEPRSRRMKLPWPSIKVIFPTKTTVRQSVLGQQGGGTIFCRRNQWEAAKFPRELFHDSKSRAGAILMHCKMIIANIRDASSSLPFSADQERHSSTDSDTETENSEEEISDPGVGWAYVGSHNFTPSAWGTLSGSPFNPVLNIVNYELGIAFPLQDQRTLDSVACWERPAKKYKPVEDRPWMQEESEFFRLQVP